MKAFVATFAALLSAAIALAQPQPPPGEPTRRERPSREMAADFDSVFVRIPCAAAGAEGVAQFTDNPAGKTWTRANIAGGVEPAASPLGIYMQATVCELAARTQAGAWSSNLDAVLFPGAPKPPAFQPGGRPAMR